jgi:hypothetical protein
MRDMQIIKDDRGPAQSKWGAQASNCYVERLRIRCQPPARMAVDWGTYECATDRFAEGAPDRVPDRPSFDKRLLVRTTTTHTRRSVDTEI